jgi:hypothetical protein
LHFSDQKKKQKKNVQNAENFARRLDPVRFANKTASSRTRDKNVENTSCDEEKQVERK